MAGIQLISFGSVLSIHLALITLAALFVILRFFVKIKLVRNVGPDDYVILFSLASAIICVILLCFEGYLADEIYVLAFVEPVRLSKRLKVTFFAIIAYDLSIISTKLSFLLMYLRIFRTKYMRIAVWISIGIVMAFGCWAMFAHIFFCRPVHYFWKTDPIPYDSSNCLNALDNYIAFTILNIVTDLLIILLPIPFIRQVMLRRSLKLALIMIFLLGGLTCVASILRLLGVIQAFGSIEFNLIWGGQPIAVWMSLEICLAIICCCLPPLRPLAAGLLSRLKIRDRIKNWSYLSTSDKGWTSKSTADKSQDSRGCNDDSSFPRNANTSSPHNLQKSIEVTTTTTWHCYDDKDEVSPC